MHKSTLEQQDQGEKSITQRQAKASKRDSQNSSYQTREGKLGPIQTKQKPIQAKQRPIQRKSSTDSGEVIQLMNEEKKQSTYVPPKKPMTKEDSMKLLGIKTDLQYQLYNWLRTEDFSSVKFTNEGYKSNYRTFLLDKKITIDNSTVHEVRMNVHHPDDYDSALGSIWVCKVQKRKSDLDAQTNPNYYELFKLWKSHYKTTKKETEEEEEEETTTIGQSSLSIPKPLLVKDKESSESKVTLEEAPSVSEEDIQILSKDVGYKIDGVVKGIEKVYLYNLKDVRIGKTGEETRQEDDDIDYKNSKNKALYLALRSHRDQVEDNTQILKIAMEKATDLSEKKIGLTKCLKSLNEQIEDLKYLWEIREKYYDNITTPFW
ncbi:hypothetical protein BKI52_32900 [marine bacterium AO1-C]|nr:hypothetical protein BKI52_32900 [marine bacterium AO1-C]